MFIKYSVYIVSKPGKLYMTNLWMEICVMYLNIFKYVILIVLESSYLEKKKQRQFLKGNEEGYFKIEL